MLLSTKKWHQKTSVSWYFFCFNIRRAEAKGKAIEIVAQFSFSQQIEWCSDIKNWKCNSFSPDNIDCFKSWFQLFLTFSNFNNTTANEVFMKLSFEWFTFNVEVFRGCFTKYPHSSSRSSGYRYLMRSLAHW